MTPLTLFRVLCTTLLLTSWTAAASAHEQATFEGTLVQRHAHTSSGEQTDTTWALRNGDTDIPVADAQPAKLIGQDVALSDSDPARTGLQGAARRIGDATLAPAPAPGARTVLVVLLATPDVPYAAASADTARSAVFTSPWSSNALFQQQSDGSTRLVGRLREDGDVAGPLGIGQSTAGCDVDAIASAADAAARGAGFAPEAYDHIMYVLPPTQACAWGGLGEMPGRRTWTNGTLATSVVAHELGHNLGAHHANLLECGGPTGPVALSPSCSSVEYGDPFDVMGLPGVLMSSWHRAQVGQLPAAQQLRLRTSQSVTLTSASIPGPGGTRLLLIPRKRPHEAVQSWLALELRSRRDPFDSWEADAPVTTGVSMRVVPDFTQTEQSQLLDTHPDTPTSSDAPLQPGESLEDSEHGISVRVDGVSGGSAQVNVTMPAFVDDVPPSAPGYTALRGNTSAVTIDWSAATDDEGVHHYDIEREGAVIASSTGLSFRDDRVADLATARYRVVAVDGSGNRSSSPVVTIKLDDVTPPTAVPGLGASVNGSTVTLRWSAAGDNRRVSQYLISRNGARVGERSTTTFSQQAPSGTHRYVVRAVDASGNVGPTSAISVTVGNGGSSVGNGSGVSPGTPPRVRLVRWRWEARRRVMVMTFSASGARSMVARVKGRTIASVRGTRLTARVRVPRGVRRTVSVTARGPGGARREQWIVR